VIYGQVNPCECQKEHTENLKREALLKYCQLPAGTEHMTLASFQTQGKGIMQIALATARDFAKQEGQVRFLTLGGKSDQGKTHLAIAITREWLAQGRPARFAQVPLLLKELKDGFDLEGENSYRMRFDRLCKIGLLVLDDLGTQKSTPWALEQLQMLIDYRAMSALPLVVTTNRPLPAIVGDEDQEHALASMRISSRLQRESYCRVIVMGGDESRTWRLAR
jgi:DNA replication protein DnaC